MSFKHVAVIVSITLCGCQTAKNIKSWLAGEPEVQPVRNDHVYNAFVNKDFDWRDVRRIVIMPLANQGEYTEASDEMLRTLAPELQNMGDFEVVVGRRESNRNKSDIILTSGQFDELEVLQIARDYNAQAVVFGKITEYRPYGSPVVGMRLVIVSADEGVAIAGIDGVWDAREQRVLDEAVSYYNSQLALDGNVAGQDIIFESPVVFRKYVSHDIGIALNQSRAQPEDEDESSENGEKAPKGDEPRKGGSNGVSQANGPLIPVPEPTQ